MWVNQTGYNEVIISINICFTADWLCCDGATSDSVWHSCLTDRLLIVEYHSSPLPTYRFGLARKHLTVLDRLRGGGLASASGPELTTFIILQEVGLLRFLAVRQSLVSYVKELTLSYQHLKCASGKAYVLLVPKWNINWSAYYSNERSRSVLPVD